MIMNRQRRVRIPVTALEKFLARARRMLRLPAASFTVCFVSDREIARWNDLYRGKKGSTDVLSFPVQAVSRKYPHPRKPRRRLTNRRTAATAASPAEFDLSPPYLGDIAIAPAVARRNARRFGRSFREEVCILVLHGMLHLLGYDHETDTGQMGRREQSLRRQLGLT